MKPLTVLSVRLTHRGGYARLAKRMPSQHPQVSRIETPSRPYSARFIVRVLGLTMSFVDSGYQGDEAQRVAYEASRISITVVRRRAAYYLASTGDSALPLAGPNRPRSPPNDPSAGPPPDDAPGSR